MKQGILVIIIGLLGISLFVPAEEEVFKKLHILQGTWKMTTKRGVVCEEWKKINNGLLQSRGYMVRGTDTIITERVALTNENEGIFYTSTVEDQNNQQPISFKMTKTEGARFVFGNPTHDFPKRIVYHFITPDSLHAYVDDGTETGKRQNFYYKKQ